MVGKELQCSGTKDVDLLCGCVLFQDQKDHTLRLTLFHARPFIAILGVHGSRIVKQSA